MTLWRNPFGGGLWRQPFETGAEAFVGAYDAIPNLAHVYEPARRTLTSYTGNLCRLRRVSDDAERNFTYVSDSDPELDKSAISTWLGGVAGYYVTVFDQVGSIDLTQATAGAQPLYVASGQNSKPVMRGDGGQWLGVMSVDVFRNQGGGKITCAACSVDTTGTEIMAWVQIEQTVNKARATLYYNDAEMVAGGRRLDTDDNQTITGGSHTANVFGLYEARFDWANANLYLLKDGTQVASSTSFQTAGDTSDTAAASFKIFEYGGSGLALEGDMATAIFSNAAADDAALRTAINSFWAVYS